MTQTVWVTKGLPASGKTTWARGKINDMPPGSTIRINKDDIRAMISNQYTKGNERLVLAVRDELLMGALEEGKHVIIDDTNLNPIHIKTIRGFIDAVNDGRKKKVVMDVVTFDKSVADCIKDDATRAKSVGAQVIRDMHKRWVKKVVKDMPVYAEQDAELMEAIIVDIDGTVALMGDRSPYDASKCIEDTVHEPVRNVIDMFLNDNTDYRGFNTKLKERKLIFLSGRDAKYRASTDMWLKYNLGLDFVDFKLYMRPEGDCRKDSVVKKELYEQYVKNRYNVLFVLDDRDQVVNMWRRDLKLPCLQVWYGDF